MFQEYTVGELAEMDTKAEAQAADLKVDEEGFRVWLCRVTDEPQYEVRIDGTWYDVVPGEAKGTWTLYED